jgi:hypothetical protein
MYRPKPLYFRQRQHQPAAAQALTGRRQGSKKEIPLGKKAERVRICAN